MEVNEISARFDYEVNKQKGILVLDEYNKSLYLTKAQAKYVEQALRNFEYGDALRHILGDLIVENNTVPVATGQTGMFEVDSQEDIKQIVYEHINGAVKTIPLDYNDLHDARVNPFRKPYNKLAYRLIGTDIQKLLIFSEVVPTDYYYVYCKEPQPIILEDLTTTGLTINDVATPTTSELPYDSILDVVSSAVNMAIADSARFAPKPKKQD